MFWSKSNLACRRGSFLVESFHNLGQMICDLCDLLPLDDLDLSGQISFVVCIVWPTLPGGSRIGRMIYDVFPELNLYDTDPAQHLNTAG